MKTKLFKSLVTSIKEGGGLLKDNPEPELCGAACPPRHKRTREDETCYLAPGHETPHRSKSGAVWLNRKSRKS